MTLRFPLAPPGSRFAPTRAHPALPSRRLLLAAFALAAALGLLAALARVMREAVHQGDLRREATARHSAATWHCNTLPSMRMRAACLGELNAPPPREILIAAQPD